LQKKKQMYILHEKQKVITIQPQQQHAKVATVINKRLP